MGIIVLQLKLLGDVDTTELNDGALLQYTRCKFMPNGDSKSCMISGSLCLIW